MRVNKYRHVVKTLLLIRHAHASLQYAGIKDHERPLTAGGIASAEIMALTLKEKIGTPGLVISSPATRALDTAIILASALDYPRHEILVESKVYHGHTEDLYNLIVGLPNDQDLVMITGHNPAITQLANSFMQKKIDYIPNTGVAFLQFDAKAWEEIALAHACTNFMLRPDMDN